MDLENLKFPIGKFNKPDPITTAHTEQWIDDIAAFPNKVKTLINGLSDDQLSWVYRPGGWNIRQVVHHCADSHMNSFIRFKLSLTEDQPTIKPYDEAAWATMPDTTVTDPLISLQLLEALHARWVVLLRHLEAHELERTFIHPEHGRQFTVAVNIGIYAWHCNHHRAHIEQALKYEGTFDQVTIK